MASYPLLKIGRSTQGRDWGFVDDPAVALLPMPCLRPRDGDPRRCHARKKRTDPPVRCGKLAVRGYAYCLTHGHRLGSKRGGARHTKNRSAAVVSFYAARVGASLKDRLEEMSRMEPGRRHCLADEVDLARLTCEQAVATFEAACFREQKASPELQAAAVATLRCAIDHVSDVVSKAARVRQTSLETVDVEQLAFIVEQVVIATEEIVTPMQGGREACDMLTARLRGIKLPERRGTGGPDRAQLARMFRDAAGAIEESVAGDPPKEESA